MLYVPAIALLLATAGHAQVLAVSEQWATTGPPPVGPLVSITGMAEAANGEIVVTDARGQMVVALDSSGRRSRVVSRAGNGPGEVRAPHLAVRAPDGSVWIHDLGHAAIEVFDDSLRFRRRVRLEKDVVNPKGLAVLESGIIVLSGGMLAQAFSIHTYNADGSLRASWLPIPKGVDPRVAGGPVSGIGPDSVVFSRAAPHEIGVYSVSTQQFSQVAADSALLDPIGEDFTVVSRRNGRVVRSFRWSFPQSRYITRLADGRMLNVITIDEEEKKSIWDLYGTDGALIDRLEVGRAYVPYGMTHDGDVLASYRDPLTDEAVAVRLDVRVR